MDFDILSSSDLSENLKCTICKNYLSYLPIYITAGGQNICGRCPRTPDQEKCTRNLAFEALSQFLHFPCRFKNEGCEEKMLPKNLPQHEQVCPYKIITCPGSSLAGCEWQGAFSTVLQHCLDKHFEFFLNENGEFTVDLRQPVQSENLLQYQQSLYIFWKKFDVTTNILQCAIYHIEGEINMDNYSCAVSLKNGKKVYSDEGCTTAYHDKEYVTVVLDCLKSDDQPVVSGKITIGKAIESGDVVQERIDEELLRQLQCTNCTAYVLPPILYCYENKIHCLSCSSKCQIQKNYNLDNIANLLNYPCKYKKNGCKIILKPVEMKKHQIVCQYGDSVCPFSQYLKCSWSGMGKDMITHIQESHKEKFIESGKEISVDYELSNVEQYIIEYSNKFFLVVFSALDEWKNICTLNWAVLKMGNFEETFMYDIEIIDQNHNNRKFVARQLCLPLSDIDDLFQDKEEYCSFVRSQLEGLLLDDYNVSFKVCILQ